jgi:DNA (cytosine-5)-methyltransferase 1
VSVDSPISVIDLFAGPGGLGEGFTSLGRAEGKPRFNIHLSIEKDPVAHLTLELRAFFRQFPHGRAPNSYYQHVRGLLTRAELYNEYPKAATAAMSEAWNIELGNIDVIEVRKRIQTLLRDSEKWVLIGGPPCQAYSNMGRSRNKGKENYVAEDDPRQYLYVEYLQILADHRPAVFVMENVKGLLSARLNDQRIFSRILDDLHSPGAALKREGRQAVRSRGGYRIYSLEQPSMFGECDLKDFVVRAERHGIPQARHRVILLGVRDDISLAAPGTLAVRPPVSVRTALDGMPRLRSGLPAVADSPDEWKRWISTALKQEWARAIKGNGQKDVYEEIARTIDGLRSPRADRGGEFLELDQECKATSDWMLDSRLGGVCNHTTRSHMPSDLHRYLFASAFASVRARSPKLTDFPDNLLPAHKNVGKTRKEGGDFDDRFRVQLWSRPSTTITSHISKDGHYYIHPDPSQCRSLTVREAARLQTFPENYFFCGGRTAQYHQVGNAVPPLMAREIAMLVSDILS